MRKKIILRQIIGVWAENDLKIGIFETDQPIVYKQQAKLPKFPQKQDNNKWPSKGPSGLSHLSEGQCLWLYYLQQEENHCQLSDFMTQYTFECLEDVGGPDPHQTQNLWKKTCMEVEVIRRGGALLLLFNMPRWGKHVGRQARQ